MVMRNATSVEKAVQLRPLGSLFILKAHEDGRTFAQVSKERASNEAQETEEQTD